MPTAEEYIQFMPAWIRDNPRAKALWIEGAGEFGYDNALEYIQQQDIYDTWFPGNRRDDGSLRYTEGEYLSAIDGYKTRLQAVGVEPSVFAETFVKLIEGDVSPAEFWDERVAPTYDRVIERGEGMMDRYASDWDLEMTREALFVSLLDPDVLGHKILNRQIGISELRYEADIAFGTDVSNRYKDLTEELYDRGYGVDQVRSTFQEADTMMPVLNVLAGRHADPDDTFDLDEFTAASLFNDPGQARRMRRLLAQEESSFTGNKITGYRNSDKTGGLSGLDEL